MVGERLCARGNKVFDSAVRPYRSWLAVGHGDGQGSLLHQARFMDHHFSWVLTASRRWLNHREGFKGNWSTRA